MNLRQELYFSLVNLRGQPLGRYYHRYLEQYQNGIPADTTRQSLARLLQHCEQAVPYYAEVIRQKGRAFLDDPVEYLQDFPVLTREKLHRHFAGLKSSDLAQRQWFTNWTGGSTGEPAQFIQDNEHISQVGAISLLFSRLAGKETGEPEFKLWGSDRDTTRNHDSWRAILVNALTRTHVVNSALMTPARMREFLRQLNKTRPKLIVTYAESIYELARFAEGEGIEVRPQAAIMTSAGKLYPFMREKAQQVFQCPVYDRYGSREFGDMACETPRTACERPHTACERPHTEGLWVAPWGCYLEVVDDQGKRLPDGVEGEILVTSLTNYAMPLIRYKIGDRGILTAQAHDAEKEHFRHGGQIVKEVIGRTMDFFKTQDGGLVNPGFFMANLYHRDWIAQYQIVQKAPQAVTYRMVKYAEPPRSEFDEIVRFTRKALGKACEVSFEFVDEIPLTASGKFRFLISEVT
jgi:phenylacetate-CoA ligase